MSNDIAVLIFFIIPFLAVLFYAMWCFMVFCAYATGSLIRSDAVRGAPVTTKWVIKWAYNVNKDFCQL